MQTETLETEYGAASKAYGLGGRVFRSTGEPPVPKTPGNFLTFKGMLEPEDDPEELRAFAEYLGYKSVEIREKPGPDGPTAYENLLGTGPRRNFEYVVVYESVDSETPSETYMYSDEDDDISESDFEIFNSSQLSEDVADIMRETPLGDLALDVLCSKEEQFNIAWEYPDLFHKTPTGIIKPNNLDAYAVISYLHTETHDSSHLYEMTEEGRRLRRKFSVNLHYPIMSVLQNNVEKTPTITLRTFLSGVKKVIENMGSNYLSISDLQELGQFIHDRENGTGRVEDFPMAVHVPPSLGAQSSSVEEQIRSLRLEGVGVSPQCDDTKTQHHTTGNIT